MQGSSLSLQKKLFRLSGETCGRRWAWCLAVPGMHSMVWRAVTAGSLLECGMAAPLRATSLLSFPLLVFLPEQRKAREARQTMSGFWGEGEFEGEGPLFTAGKRGPPPQGALPGRSPIQRKRGRLVKRRPRFVSWELSLTPGSEAPVRRAQLRMRPLSPRPVPWCSALNGESRAGRAFPRAFGRGESEGKARLLPQAEGALPPQHMFCLRPALPWWPGRSAVPRWWG